MKSPKIIKEYPAGKRLSFLDSFRGLAIFLMVLFNALGNYESVPAFLKHAWWSGFTIVDLVVPMFLFGMGFAYELSFKRRLLLHGKTLTILHFVRRNFLIFIIGLSGALAEIIMIQQNLTGWGVLQTLGACGIFSLAFMFIKNRLRVLMAFIFLITYQIGILLGLNWLILIFIKSGLGGPFATISWAFILIFASTMVSLFKKDNFNEIMKKSVLSGTILTILAVLSSFIVPVSKDFVSISYILLTTGFCVYIILFFYILNESLNFHISIIEKMGKNALFLYIISFFLIFLENLIIPPRVCLIYAASGAFLMLLVCMLIGWFLDYKKIYIKI